MNIFEWVAVASVGRVPCGLHFALRSSGLPSVVARNVGRQPVACILFTQPIDATVSRDTTATNRRNRINI